MNVNMSPKIKSRLKKSLKIICSLVSVVGFSAFATDLKVGDDAPNFKLQATTTTQFLFFKWPILKVKVTGATQHIAGH